MTEESQPKLKLPWSLVEDTDPGCARCVKDGARGQEIRNADGQVILSSGHDTYYMNEFDLKVVVEAVNEYFRSHQPP